MARDESRYTNALSGTTRKGLELRFAATVDAGGETAGAWRPDLLLVDLEDFAADACGQLIRLVRSRVGQLVPVLLVVRGQVPEKEVPEIQAAGLVDFVTKPLNSPILEYRLSNLQRTKRMLTGARSIPAVVMYFGLHVKDDDQTPDVLLDYMTRTYQRAVELVEGQGGMLHRQGGGGLIAVYSDQESRAGERALDCALEMRATWNSARQEIEGQGLRPPQGGIGIAAGTVSLGRVVNAALRLDTYALGDPVLRASQLQVLTRSDLVDILVDETVQRSAVGAFRFRSVRLNHSAPKVPPLFHLEARQGGG